ncbi:mechanosensitive ion channel family protein [Nibricoccus aquaticus]|nr:mechanosensitive ion channel family protein [Nibricoccus aquaticus]
MFFSAAQVFAQSAAPAGGATEAANTTAAAAAVASGQVKMPETPEFIEHAVDVILEQFDVQNSENGPVRYIACAAILLITFIVCKVVVNILFAFLRKLTARTETTVDDKLFRAVQGPVTALILVVGSVAAIKALKLTPSADNMLGYMYTIAFSFVVFWFLLRIFNTVLDHLHEKAVAKKMGVAAFMPWIKKTLLAIFFVFGVLMIAQSLGADVKAFLAGLGIGGLAVALAAQDTIANIFGSVVVAVDQPFKIGETIQVAGTTGAVEDIGLRSTKIRRVDKALVVIPNKTVASESITNLARFTQRRVEQVLGLTYSTSAEQMEELVGEIRRLLLAEEEIDPTSVICYFRDFSASSLDIWLVYVVKDPDFHKHMQLRMRLNLAFIKAVETRGLSFAFPTQTVLFEGEIARKMAEKKKTEG